MAQRHKSRSRSLTRPFIRMYLEERRRSSPAAGLHMLAATQASRLAVVRACTCRSTRPHSESLRDWMHRGAGAQGRWPPHAGAHLTSLKPSTMSAKGAYITAWLVRGRAVRPRAKQCAFRPRAPVRACARPGGAGAALTAACSRAWSMWSMQMQAHAAALIRAALSIDS